jgi:hypothetical protein
MTGDEHIRLLQQLVKADHDELLARVQGWVDDAAAKGDHLRYRRNLAYLEGLKAIPVPWEKSTA